MKTWEVRVRMDNGEIGTLYIRASSREALYEHLCDVCPDGEVIGCDVVEG
jgi:hypothetical protein